MIMPDSEILRLEKRQRGLQRVATAINDLTIYGIYQTNFPKLVEVLEHAKDHVKAEIAVETTDAKPEVMDPRTQGGAKSETQEFIDEHLLSITREFGELG